MNEQSLESANAELRNDLGKIAESRSRALSSLPADMPAYRAYLERMMPRWDTVANTNANLVTPEMHLILALDNALDAAIFNIDKRLAAIENQMKNQ